MSSDFTILSSWSFSFIKMTISLFKLPLPILFNGDDLITEIILFIFIEFVFVIHIFKSLLFILGTIMFICMWLLSFRSGFFDHYLFSDN